MRRIIALVTGFVLALMLALPSQAEERTLTYAEAVQACEQDARIVYIPFHWKYDRIRYIKTQLVSVDCGNYRYLERERFAWDSGNVEYLDDGVAYKDSWGDGSSSIIGAFDYYVDKSTWFYFQQYEQCWEPCAHEISFIVREVNAIDTFINARFNPEGDDYDW